MQRSRSGWLGSGLADLPRPTRRGQRSIFSVEGRVALLEDDADDWEDFKATVDRRLGDMTKIMIGILTSLTVGALMLAVNVIVLRGN